MNTILQTRFVLLALASALATTAFAGWTSTVIRSPYPNQVLRLNSISDQGVFSGMVGEGGAYWSDSPASATFLRPLWADSASVIASDASTQVGSYYVGRGRAARWTGTAASMISLHPEWSYFSQAVGFEGDITVGRVDSLAAYWQGEALTLLGSGASVGIDQGRVLVNQESRAKLYDIASATWTNLNPAGATRSYPVDAFEGTQIGMAALGSLQPGYWRGTAESFTPLFEPAEETYVTSIHRNLVAGYRHRSRRSSAGNWDS
jgi:hypothetical protein